MLIQGKILSCGDNLSEAFSIRRKVFIEEQGIPEEIEFDGLDNEAMHVIVFEQDSCWKDNNELGRKAVATGRIFFDGTSCHIGRIAVLKEYRNKKYGDFTVRMLLNKAFTAGINEVVVFAQSLSVGFYEKIGFTKEGEPFLNADIEYIKMIVRVQDVVTSCQKKK